MHPNLIQLPQNLCQLLKTSVSNKEFRTAITSPNPNTYLQATWEDRQIRDRRLHFHCDSPTATAAPARSNEEPAPGALHAAPSRHSGCSTCHTSCHSSSSLLPAPAITHTMSHSHRPALYLLETLSRADPADPVAEFPHPAPPLSFEP